MTVSSTTNRWSYTGDGTTKSFACTDRVFAGGDLKVYVDGAPKTLGSHFTVSGVGNAAGGNVTFATAPASAAVVAIVRDVPATQSLDLAALGSFPAEENEKALDRLTILVQQLVDRQLRALRQPDGDNGTIGELPSRAARAGRLLGFDAAGDPSPGAVALPAALTALDYVRVDAAAAGYELRTPAQARADLGADDAAGLTAGTLAPARIADGSLAGAKLAAGAVADHLGYAPLNRAGDTMTGPLNLQAALTLAGDPASALQAATKQYVDGVAAGLGKRGTVRLATIADHGLSGRAAIDGVTPAAGDLVLARTQATPADNGVYVAGDGAWTRSLLFDGWDEHVGSLIAVQEGASLADTLWLCVANSGGTLGTDAVLWSQITPGSGGTVTNIATANGVKGGPITSTGTLELDIGGLPEDAAPDLTADFVASFDASADAHRKVRLQNIGGAALSAHAASFTAGTTPNTVYVVGDTADATLPAAAAVPNGFRATFKNATDGKGMRVLADGSDTIDGLSGCRVPGREALEVMRTAAGSWTVLQGPSFLVGHVLSWASASVPAGWAACGGQALSRADYKGLYDEIGVTFGSGDGSTTFNVPDLRGRVVAGKDDMGGTSANRLTSGGSGISGATLGAAGGAQTHTLAIGEMPSHGHRVFGPGGGGEGGFGAGTFVSGSTGSTGGGGAHQNTQPTLVMNFLVKT